jgi:predicted regulator of Ras-like GTPase activity (Roadblock/LC7/MglB family)
LNLFAVQAHMPAVSGRRLPLAFVEKAERHRQRGELDKALEACEQVVRECPGYVSGHIALARVLLALNDTPAAREALNAAIALDPMNPVAQNLLARLDLASGFTDRATHRLKDILFFYPNDAEAASLLTEASRAVATGPSLSPAVPLSPTPQPTQTLAEAAQAELETLRTTPGVAGVLIVDEQGLPMLGSLGRGEESDNSSAATVSAAIRAWSETWAQAGTPTRAIVECSEFRMVIAPCGECALVVALSLRTRPGRVLRAIDQAAEKLRAASLT